MGSVNVVNIRKHRGPSVYIGRGGRGKEGSPLANPRRLGDRRPAGGVWSREETIELFEKELREALSDAPTALWNGKPVNACQRAAIRREINEIAAAARSGPVDLACFCAPLSCHGDVIRKVVLERI